MTATASPWIRASTVYALLPYLKTFDNLTVVTNSLMVAQSFLDKDDHHTRVLLAGGRLRRDSISVVGMPESLPQVNLNLCFFSARGIVESIGASEIDPEEVVVKQTMIAHSADVVLLADGSKWGKIAPFTIVPLLDLKRVMTSSDAPPDQVDRFRHLGIRVDVVEG